MSTPTSVRRLGKRILGYRGSDLVRQTLGKSGPAVASYRARLAGRCALEIGGPSPSFCDDGGLPLYSILKSVDNCLFSESTIWSDEIEGATFRYHPHKEPGRQFFREATELAEIQGSSYELVLASHCLEHIANPLRALREWKRVITDNGFLLLILPHKDGTFDWRRPVTSLEHLIHDYQNEVGEDDLTHVPEVLALHDSEKDPFVGSAEKFKQRCLENKVYRAIHHHVFTTLSAAALVDYAGYQLMDVTPSLPINIVILAKNSVMRPDNSNFLNPDARCYRRSPFPSDNGTNKM
jgi:SAM-dependent methyltransferase